MDPLDSKDAPQDHPLEYDPSTDGLYAINRWSPARLLTRDRLSTVISTTRPEFPWFAESEWTKEVAAQIAQKHAGDMCYLVNYEIDHRESHYGQRFRMAIAPCSYAEHLATKELLQRHPDIRQQIGQLLQQNPRQYVHNACPSSIIINVVIISDKRRLLAVQRSTAVQDARNLWTVGPCEGMIFRPPIPGTNQGSFEQEDLFGLAERCLREEIGLEPEHYASGIVVSWIGLKLELVRGHVVAQVKLAIPEEEALTLASRSHSIFEANRFEWLPFNTEHINSFIVHGNGPLADRDWIQDARLAFQETWRMWDVWNPDQTGAVPQLTAETSSVVAPRPKRSTQRGDAEVKLIAALHLAIGSTRSATTPDQRIKEVGTTLLTDQQKPKTRTKAQTRSPSNRTKPWTRTAPLLLSPQYRTARPCNFR